MLFVTAPLAPILDTIILAAVYLGYLIHSRPSQIVTIVVQYSAYRNTFLQVLVERELSNPIRILRPLSLDPLTTMSGQGSNAGVWNGTPSLRLRRGRGGDKSQQIFPSTPYTEYPGLCPASSGPPVKAGTIAAY